MKTLVLFIVASVIFSCKTSISKEKVNKIKEEVYGIDKEHAHKKAIELIPEDFFWNSIDEFASFGSDEGDLALAEFREWKKLNPNIPTYECLKWTIESLGELSMVDFNDEILDRKLIKSQISDENFDDHYFIFTVDICTIATGFGQLVDDGEIDEKNKPLIQRAIERQKIWAELKPNWDSEFKTEYIRRLNVLKRVLKEA